MSSIAGIDYDSTGIYITEVDEDDGAFIAGWKLELEVYNGVTDTSFNRARIVRGRMPPRTRWEDSGVIAIGIEEPFSRQANSIRATARVQGAILACLPNLPVYALHPNTRDGWKGRTVGKANASKESVAEWAQANGAPPHLRQDLYDAFCIARAAREIQHTKPQRGSRQALKGAA